MSQKSLDKVRKWIFILHATDQPDIDLWLTLQNNLTTQTLNLVITELEGEIDKKAPEINAQIDSQIEVLQNKKI